ncbi:helix-turn-helix transcriptional regulator [Methylocella tundrae]|uniref:Transcriptional regulator, LuxR family n=1 Tax=Methylocella tundrae TaxID=227605 RepID=A0A4U8Z7R6_METTU|nr:LuxR family transcriptional regulator [Methylocella tundrae]WPP02797.1 LuxR family transcriptional regulator [Methylocella tundrae]VFU17596.1 Transcriptional regulator, LuxR family [Methylocella tundrae]
MYNLDTLALGEILGLEATKSGDSLEAFTDKIREHFNLKNSIYVCPTFRPAEASLPFYLTNYDQRWVTHYTKENYQQIDPTFQVAMRSVAPRDWSLLPRSTPKVARFFDEAKDAGIGPHGITIPVHGPTPGTLGIFTVSSDDTDASWLGRRHPLVRDMVHVAHYLHQRACDEYADGPTIDPNVITKREIEALEFTSDGKTIAQISASMRISPETVKTHLDSARFKLKALNRVHAVARAIRTGLIR